MIGVPGVLGVRFLETFPCEKFLGKLLRNDTPDTPSTPFPVFEASLLTM